MLIKDDLRFVCTWTCTDSSDHGGITVWKMTLKMKTSQHLELGDAEFDPCDAQKNKDPRQHCTVKGGREVKEVKFFCMYVQVVLSADTIRLKEDQSKDTSMGALQGGGSRS